MALMKHREGNEIKWIGSRPGHRGTQWANSKTASNEVQIIHTVGVGKICCIAGFSLTVNTSVADKYGELYVRNVGDTYQYFIARFHMDATGQAGIASGLPFPIEVPAGYDICVQSNNGALNARGFVYGWEEDA